MFRDESAEDFGMSPPKCFGMNLRTFAFEERMPVCFVFVECMLACFVFVECMLSCL